MDKAWAGHNVHARAKSVYVHKAAAYVWLDVPLRGPHKVVHKKGCNGPACFNPDHLLVFQTCQEIVEAQKAGLVRGQVLGEKRHGTKMTLVKALQIKAALIAVYSAKRNNKEPELFVDIAERLDVTINQVRAIHSRRAWKYIWKKDLKIRHPEGASVMAGEVILKKVGDNEDISGHESMTRKNSTNWSSRATTTGWSSPTLPSP